MAKPNGPRYPVPWVSTYFIAALILIAGALAAPWVIGRFSAKFDWDDPDFRFLEAIVQSGSPRRGDFSGLNGGDWRALCLVGSGGDPEKALAAGHLAPALAERMRRAYVRESPDLDPTEFALLYASSNGAVTVLRHPHGFAFARAGAAVCTARQAPVLTLPAGL